jgi:hypothetical protein
MASNAIGSYRYVEVTASSPSALTVAAAREPSVPATNMSVTRELFGSIYQLSQSRSIRHSNRFISWYSLSFNVIVNALS